MPPSRCRFHFPGSLKKCVLTSPFAFRTACRSDARCQTTVIADENLSTIERASGRQRYISCCCPPAVTGDPPRSLIFVILFATYPRSEPCSLSGQHLVVRKLDVRASDNPVHYRHILAASSSPDNGVTVVARETAGYRAHTVTLSDAEVNTTRRLKTGTQADSKLPSTH